MMKIITSLFFLFQLSISFSQSEGNIWYFGNNAGIDFNSGAAVAIGNGGMQTDEGCASVSDNSGHLLFYTDGSTVYNSFHQVMPNGSGLMGDASSTQSAIIIKKPQSNSLYYIFTVDAIENNGQNGVRYSIVDMSMLGGLGVVTTLNVLVSAPCSEKITAIQHQNGTDFWIVFPDASQTTFVSYLLSSTGLATNAAVSTGLSFSGAMGGYLKASPLGNKMATATNVGMQLFDFDNTTGLVTNQTALPGGDYGLEFSPNGRFLYLSRLSLSGSSEILQFDLFAGSSAAIISSETVIGSLNTILYGAFQIGPDHKIYVSDGFGTSGFLSVIENPNLAGVNANFQHQIFQLTTSSAQRFGLPNFHNQVFDIDTLVFEICVGDSIELKSLTAQQNYNWAIALSPSIVISADSSITVSPATNETYVLFDGMDSLFYSVVVNQKPTVDLGADLQLCPHASVTLFNMADSLAVGANYLWQSNPVNNLHLLAINSAGLYFLEVTNEFGCSSSDSLDVISTVVETGVTIDEPALLADAPSATYQWLNCDSSYAIIPGDTNQLFEPLYNGNFAVEVSEFGCVDTSACFTIAQLNVKKSKQLLPMVSISPNPTNGIFQVKSTAELKSIVIYNLFGQIIYRQDVNKTISYVDLKNQAKGVYFLITDGSQVQKVILE